MERGMGFCDLGCRHASRPGQEGVDGSGSCRTFVALFCSLKGRLVHKHMPCRDREERPPGDLTSTRDLP